MASKQELQVQQKRELEKKQESTLPARVFLPTADIYEDEDALSVVLEMPGVDKGNVQVSIEDGLLKVGGRLDFSKYQDLQPLYTEYNIGYSMDAIYLPGGGSDRKLIGREVLQE